MQATLVETKRSADGSSVATGRQVDPLRRRPENLQSRLRLKGHRSVVKRLLLPTLAGILIAIITIVTWMALDRHQTAQVARLAEIESYAVRSKLVRSMDAMLRGLHDLNDYWVRNGHLPRSEWSGDAVSDLDRFAGVEVIAWSASGGDLRYLRTPANPVYDYRPDDAEWPRFEELLGGTGPDSDSAILGPFVDLDGKVTMRVHVTEPRHEDGSLVALINTRELFAGLLLDESPGYSISVYWDDALLYRRDAPAGGIPESWTREGMIRPLTGELWRIVHTPTESLAASLRTPALPGLLGAGLAIALLVALLLFENGRARSRAAAAEIAERKLADLNADLERQIAERVRELADRSADLETITDSVAHDLRNPLNSISVNTQLLQQQYRQELGEDGLEALKRTSVGVRRMTEILDRLLGLSVVSHATFRPEPLDMENVVREVFDELNAPEQPPPVALAVDALPPAEADPTLVRTLVTNLLGNAIKYTREKDDRRIEVSAAKQNGVTVYCIRDNGIGFDPESEERMFRAFERLDGSQTEDGVGLGLDIATRVVKRHGGRIWASGRRGDGAAFYFTLAPAPGG